MDRDLIIKLVVVTILGVFILVLTVIKIMARNAFNKANKNGKLDRLVKTREERNLDNISKKYPLKGEWILTINSAEFLFQIFSNENSGYGVLHRKEIVIEELKKENDKYKIDNGFNEFYLIDDVGNISLFDENGIIENYSFRIA